MMSSMTGSIAPTAETICQLSKKNLLMMNNSFYIDNRAYITDQFPPVERITASGEKHSIQVIAKADKEIFPAVYDFTNKVWINCGNGDRFIGEVSWAYTLN